MHRFTDIDTLNYYIKILHCHCDPLGSAKFKGHRAK